MTETAPPHPLTRSDVPHGTPVLHYAKPEPLPTHGSTGRVEMIDAVRGIACLWVLMHHSYLYWVWRVRMHVLGHLNEVAWLGFHGVHLFLVISGFVLFFPVVRKHGIRGARIDNRSFFRRRIRRILPPYYAALIIFGLVSLSAVYAGNGKVFSVVNIAEHVSMLYNLDPRNITAFNGAFWSLALEFQLYLTFPLLLWGCRRFGMLATVVGALVVSVVWQVVIVPRVIVLNGVALNMQQWPTQAVWYNALPGRWSEFVMGAAAAALVVRPLRYQNVVALAVIAVCTPIAAKLNIRPSDSFRSWCDQLWGLAFASVLVLVARTPMVVARSPMVRLIAWVGGISYSIYLIHEPLLQLSERVLARCHLGEGSASRLIVFLFCGLPLLVAIGFAFHLAFERPFMSAKRPPISPDAPPPAPVPAAEIAA